MKSINITWKSVLIKSYRCIIYTSISILTFRSFISACFIHAVLYPYHMFFIVYASAIMWFMHKAFRQITEVMLDLSHSTAQRTDDQGCPLVNLTDADLYWIHIDILILINVSANINVGCRTRLYTFVMHRRALYSFFLNFNFVASLYVYFWLY